MGASLKFSLWQHKCLVVLRFQPTAAWDAFTCTQASSCVGEHAEELCSMQAVSGGAVGLRVGQAPPARQANLSMPVCAARCCCLVFLETCCTVLGPFTLQGSTYNTVSCSTFVLAKAARSMFHFSIVAVKTAVTIRAAAGIILKMHLSEPQVRGCMWHRLVRVQLTAPFAAVYHLVKWGAVYLWLSAV